MSLSCSRVSEDFEFATELPGLFCSSFPFTHPQPCSLFFFSSIEANCSRRAGGFPRPCKMASSWTVGELLLPLPYPTILVSDSPRVQNPHSAGRRRGGPASHPLCGLSFWSLLLLVGWVCLFAFLVWGLFRGFICMFILQCCEFYSGSCTY